MSFPHDPHLAKSKIIGSGDHHMHIAPTSPTAINGATLTLSNIVSCTKTTGGLAFRESVVMMNMTSSASGVEGTPRQIMVAVIGLTSPV